jgi:phosphoribosylamine--glycine ligase
VELRANVSAAIEEERPHFVIVGPEEPLAHGIVDYVLQTYGIPSVGPTMSLAKLESSKSFTRKLLAKHGIPGNPIHKLFDSTLGLEQYLNELGEFVVKPDGLTGGKGVKVFGVHMHTVREALDYCEELFAIPDAKILIEEKLDGEEFSLQSFSDGSYVLHTPPVQDHKRAYDGDTGPNTGGMGSYTCPDHSFPFVEASAVDFARDVNRRVAEALHKETGEKYKGVLFGGFMVTKDGVRLLEYNARFGDPEALNVLSLLDGDFLEICEGIINETLDTVTAQFKKSATVCKYIVPQGYPSKPVANARIDLSAVPAESDHLRIYRSAVREVPGSPKELILTGSRAVAFVGIADTLFEAEAIAESAAAAVRGPVYHRKDIGTSALVDKRIAHMADVKQRARVPIQS